MLTTGEDEGGTPGEAPGGEPDGPTTGAPLIPWMLRRINQRYRQAAASGLESAGLADLPQRGYWALMALDGGARDATQLVSAMGISKQAVSKLVDLLVEGAFVDRQADRLDRRKVVLVLTRKGRRAVEVIRTAVEATERDIVATIGEAAFSELCQTLEVLGEGR